MTSYKPKRTYWEGKPMKLTEESILTQKEGGLNLLESFAKDMKAQLELAKEEFDKTMATIDMNKTSQVLNKTTGVVVDVEKTVQEEIDALQQGDYKEKLKDALTAQYQATSYILELKSSMEEQKELNEELVSQANATQVTFLDTVADLEDKAKKKQREYSVDMRNRILMTNLITSNPPPSFDRYEGHGTAMGLLAFLNEDLEDYFADICVSTKVEKCRLVLKIFGDKSMEYKRTARRFFQQEETVTLIESEAVNMRIVYRELVHYVFTARPTGNIGSRGDNESLTNFIERWFTVKGYCGVSDTAQGKSVIRKIFENPKILNATEEVIREFKREYFVKYANEEPIGKDHVLGFVQRLDMLYFGSHLNSMKAIGETTNSGVTTGIVVLEELKQSSELEDMKREMAELRLKVASAHRSQVQNNNEFSQNYRGNNNRMNIAH